MGVELAPVTALLDKTHPTLARPRDLNNYTLGEIAGHNIVIAALPEIGRNAAAVVTTQLLNDFPSIRFGLLVGIGGAVPDIENDIDIRLGDVVVSKPTKSTGGVVQYDMGKEVPQGFERIGMLDKPPRILRTAVQQLVARHELEDSLICQFLGQIGNKYPKMVNKYCTAPEEQDQLFETSYDHRGSKTCSHCDNSKTVYRPPRSTLGPLVHYGTIGSANRVLKNAIEREKLKSGDLDIICVEMEAAGLMDSFPCLVIRGICDYADSHKNKRWQPYAAAVAAAYMKELLSNIRSKEVVKVSPAADAVSIRDVPRHSPSRDFLDNIAAEAVLAPEEVRAQSGSRFDDRLRLSSSAPKSEPPASSTRTAIGEASNSASNPRSLAELTYRSVGPELSSHGWWQRTVLYSWVPGGEEKAKHQQLLENANMEGSPQWWVKILDPNRYPSETDLRNLDISLRRTPPHFLVKFVQLSGVDRLSDLINDFISYWTSSTSFFSTFPISDRGRDVFECLDALISHKTGLDAALKDTTLARRLFTCLIPRYDARMIKKIPFIPSPATKLLATELLISLCAGEIEAGYSVVLKAMGLVGSVTVRNLGLVAWLKTVRHEVHWKAQMSLDSHTLEYAAATVRLINALVACPGTDLHSRCLIRGHFQASGLNEILTKLDEFIHNELWQEIRKFRESEKRDAEELLRRQSQEDLPA
ncbi:hypothetical protein LTR84_008247 [Exophiala bonariae]|uniref:GBD/FH3 domain-containing protein n=1 Tax=Exophiala bonariae TaxID=1690606 RepID=A0AAV9MXX4_9EURO|nr:hypothetical protein LTR84_008247 [Exophiala bonariae]